MTSTGTVITWAALGVYALVVASWWFRHILISLTRPLGWYVSPAVDIADAPSVSVVIPARNERDRIAGCVETLLAQGAVLKEIIVVDDRSDDQTAEIALQAAGGDPRVRIVRIDDLPAGWAGKAHACQRGGEAATADWILFADADCRFRNGGIAGAASYAKEQDVDFLSLWLAADNRTFWEHMLIPLCGAIILLWFPPIRANRPQASTAFANGQFILVRRDAYRRIGGHECSREAVIEDIPLARHAKRSGLRLRTAVGPGIASVRMYTGFREVWNGWTRIYVGALQSKGKMLASVASLIGGSLLPSFGAPVAAVWIASAGWPLSHGGQILYVLLLLHFIALYSVSLRLWGLCRCARRYLLLYPVSVFLTMGILLRAWWWMVTSRPIIWRGTVTGRRPAG